MMSYARGKVDKDYDGVKTLKEAGGKMFQSIVGVPSFYSDENLDVTK